MDDLPTSFDAIIIGTGMTEAVIAAALSRIGKSVLHVDCNDYYGENWASFNLENIMSWIASNEKNKIEEKVLSPCAVHLIDSNEKFLRVRKKSTVTNLKKNEYVKKNDYDSLDCENAVTSNNADEKNLNDGAIKENLGQQMDENNFEKKLFDLSKRFNLDLCPKLLYSRGPMVELLISSNVAKYAEFKVLNRVLTWRSNQLESVPCSRADVFSAKNVSVVHKRLLVKVLTLFADYTNNLQEFYGFENKTFKEFLIDKKLPDNLIHYILYVMALGDDSTLCMNGVRACKIFLESLGRYGNTPFIFPMYGSGELPQCFCRLCAVFGGIYCLNREVEGLIVKDNECIAVISNGMRLNAKKVVMSSAYCIDDFSIEDDFKIVSRGIFITEKSILSSQKEVLTLLQFPPVPKHLNHPVTVFEFGSGTYTCPENYFVVHMTCEAIESASTDLKYVVESLFETNDRGGCEETSKPDILWSLTWNTTCGNRMKEDAIMKNLKICRGIDTKLDYDLSLIEAKKIFEEFYPGEEFLPRAPDPEEIVFDSEDKVNEISKETNESILEPEKEQINEETAGKNISDSCEPVPTEGQCEERSSRSVQ